MIRYSRDIRKLGRETRALIDIDDELLRRIRYYCPQIAFGADTPDNGGRDNFQTRDYGQPWVSEWPMPRFGKPPEWRLNTWYVPGGASRWSEIWLVIEGPDFPPANPSANLIINPVQLYFSLQTPYDGPLPGFLPSDGDPNYSFRTPGLWPVEWYRIDTNAHLVRLADNRWWWNKWCYPPYGGSTTGRTQTDDEAYWLYGLFGPGSVGSYGLGDPLLSADIDTWEGILLWLTARNGYFNLSSQATLSNLIPLYRDYGFSPSSSLLSPSRGTIQSGQLRSKGVVADGFITSMGGWLLPEVGWSAQEPVSSFQDEVRGFPFTILGSYEDVDAGARAFQEAELEKYRTLFTSRGMMMPYRVERVDHRASVKTNSSPAVEAVDFPLAESFGRAELPINQGSRVYSHDVWAAQSSFDIFTVLKTNAMRKIGESVSGYVQQMANILAAQAVNNTRCGVFSHFANAAHLTLFQNKMLIVPTAEERAEVRDIDAGAPHWHCWGDPVDFFPRSFLHDYYPDSDRRDKQAALYPDAEWVLATTTTSGASTVSATVTEELVKGREISSSITVDVSDYGASLSSGSKIVAKFVAREDAWYLISVIA